MFSKMAVSVATTASIPYALASSSFTPKKPFYSPCMQFSEQLWGIRIGNRNFQPQSRPRFLSLVVEAKKQTFSSFDDLLENSEKPVLVDFYATWCGPCQIMSPILNEVGATLKDQIQVVKIDTEKYPKIADKYRIAALPTLIIFKDGKPCDRFEGALNAGQLIERIESSLGVKQ